MKVAITGVGGGVGQSIMKALSIASLPVELFPVDIQPMSAGLHRGIEGTVLPAPEKPEALAVWAEWISTQRIDVLFPGSDHDLVPLARARDHWAKRGLCHVLVSDVDIVLACRDKAETCRRLAAAGVPTPRSIWDVSLKDALEWARANGWPVVIKPRVGFASRHLHIVNNDEEFRFFYSRVDNPIVQEYLNLDGTIEEFTCAVFVDRQGEPIGTFMSRRDLSAGATYRAEVNSWPDLHEMLCAIGKVVRPRGVLNVQLRRTERGPVPFELNIRCSGTAAIRAHFGYNEPEMMLRHYVLGEELVVPEPRRGYAFRYWNEVFVEGVSRDDLTRVPGRPHGFIRAWP
jgi:carbamoyl-phosphate synthase large subunit